MLDGRRVDDGRAPDTRMQCQGKEETIVGGNGTPPTVTHLPCPILPAVCEKEPPSQCSNTGKEVVQALEVGSMWINILPLVNGYFHHVFLELSEAIVVCKFISCEICR
jgi:hypothetical protein